MINRRRLSVATAASFLTSLVPARAQSDSKIVLGQSAALTGPAAQLGIQFNAGARVYFDLLNDKGGIKGRKVEINLQDDGYDPERCAENTRKFVADGVFALFGYIGTPTSLAALPLVLKSGTPFIAPFTGAMSLREPMHKNVFHLRASYNDETAQIVKQLYALGMKRIAVFHQNDAYGKAGLDGVTKALLALDSKPVAVATVERNSVDVAAAVKVLAPSNADAIVQISAYKSCAAFIRAARLAGYGGQYYNVSFVGTKALSDELGKEAAGVVISQVVPSPYNSANGITREFTAAIKAHGKEVQANYSSMEGYLAARLVADGLARSTGVLSAGSFISGLESIGSQSYGGFLINLSATRHVASSFAEMALLTADGRVRT